MYSEGVTSERDPTALTLKLEKILLLFADLETI